MPLSSPVQPRMVVIATGIPENSSRPFHPSPPSSHSWPIFFQLDSIILGTRISPRLIISQRLRFSEEEDPHLQPSTFSLLRTRSSFLNHLNFFINCETPACILASSVNISRCQPGAISLLFQRYLSAHPFPLTAICPRFSGDRSTPLRILCSSHGGKSRKRDKQGRVKREVMGGVRTKARKEKDFSIRKEESTEQRETSIHDSKFYFSVFIPFSIFLRFSLSLTIRSSFIFVSIMFQKLSFFSPFIINDFHLTFSLSETRSFGFTISARAGKTVSEPTS